MADREKVISEFEDFVKSFSKRDDTYYKGLFVSVLALLKEQEAVKPTWNRGKPFCGACGLRIRGGKFCSECGKPISWEG